MQPKVMYKPLYKSKTKFFVGVESALFELMRSEAFTEKLCQGNYIYVEKHFCINHPRYVQRNQIGENTLTRFARRHPEQCCLVFMQEPTGTFARYSRARRACPGKRATSRLSFRVYYAGGGDDPDPADLLKDYNMEVLRVAQSLPASFSGTLDKLIEWSEMTEEELAEAARLSEKTIQRLRNREEANVSIETVVQLCIGMQLPPPLSKCLVDASRRDFALTEMHLMYQFLLLACYTESLDTCNKYLRRQGLKPLGRKK